MGIVPKSNDVRFLPKSDSHCLMTEGTDPYFHRFMSNLVLFLLLNGLVMMVIWWHVLTWWKIFNGCSSITYLCWQWLDVGVAEAEVVAEEGVEAGEAQGDDLWASLALSETPLFVHFVVHVLIFFFFFSPFGHLSPFVCLCSCSIVFFFFFFNGGSQSLY